MQWNKIQQTTRILKVPAAENRPRWVDCVLRITWHSTEGEGGEELAKVALKKNDVSTKEKLKN